MIKKLLLPFFSLFLSVGIYAQTPTPTPCPPNPICNSYNTPPVNKKGWVQGSTVQYYIDPSITDPDVIQAIQDAFQNWTDSSGENGSSVTYQQSTSPLPAGTGISISKVNDIPLRDANNNPIAGKSSPAETNSTFDANGNTASATMQFDSIITDYDAVFEVFMHEIGHPAGFGECPDCADGESVMDVGSYDPEDKSTFNQSYGRATSLNCCEKKTLKDKNYSAPPLGGGGGGEPPPNGGGGGYYCTPYYWVLYYSWDEGQTWEVQDVWYAGCW